jgi:hypothetical protein
MKEAMEVIANFAAEDKSADLCCFSRGIGALLQSSGTPSLRWQQATLQQIQIRQREGGVQARSILRQAAVANFGKAPQTLDHAAERRRLMYV